MTRPPSDRSFNLCTKLLTKAQNLPGVRHRPRGAYPAYALRLYRQLRKRLCGALCQWGAGFIRRDTVSRAAPGYAQARGYGCAGPAAEQRPSPLVAVACIIAHGMKYVPHRRQRRPAPPLHPATDPISQAFYAASRRGKDLLRQALPQIAQNQTHYNRLVAAIIIGGTAAIFGVAWLFGDWVQAQFPPPSLLMH